MATKLNEINMMPQMQDAFVGWFSKVTLGVVTKSINDDGDAGETISSVSFQGIIQPLQPEELELKPEGLREWRWLQIHCYAGDLNLNNNDKITFNGIRYKVMGIRDYSLNNYIEYHVIQDYE